MAAAPFALPHPAAAKIRIVLSCSLSPQEILRYRSLVIFFLIFGTVILGDALWLLIALRRLPKVWMRIAAFFWGIAQLSALAAISLGRGSGPTFYDGLPRWIHSTVLIWHLLIVMPWLLLQTARGIVALARKLTHPPAPAADVPSITRRDFIAAAATFAPPMLSFGASALGETQLDDFRVRRLIIPLAQLPPALDGLTIAQLTDLHAGRLTRGKVMERIVEETNRLDADIIALTGDLINDSLRAMPAALELVRGLRARHVIASCEGNHDLIDNPREFYRQSEIGGLPLLRDESATITIRGHRVQILGLPWTRSSAKMSDATRALLAKRDPAAWPLLLAHHPHAWDLVDDIPLTLSGHTHGGQLMINEALGAGPMVFRYWSGVYTKPDRALVVSNGVGNWFPVRISAPAEILHITLRRA